MKDWIQDWLSDRQLDELKFFQKRNDFVDAEGKSDVYAVIGDIKKAYDVTLQIFEDSPQKFVRRWESAAGHRTVTEEHGDGTFSIKDVSEPDNFILAVCNCVASYELGEDMQHGFERWLGGPVRLFRLIDGRGKHFKKQRKISPPDARKAAEAVIERDGWDSYPVQRRTEDGPGFPNALLKAVSEQLKEDLDLESLSPVTVRRNLERTDFYVPYHARLKRRRS